MSSPLNRLVGERLDEVTFILDYWQLVASGLRLTVFTTLEVRIGELRVRVGDDPFRNRLCEQIGKTVRAVEFFDDEALVLVFEDGSEVRCSVAPEDHRGPEAMTFDAPGDPFVVI